MELSELIERADLLKYAVENCGLELVYKNGEYWGLSPFKEEKTPSFSINQDKQRFYDFSSGKGGNIIDFIKEIKKCTFPEAVDILKAFDGVSDDDYHFLPSAVKVARRYRQPVSRAVESSPTLLPDTYMDIFEEDDEKLAEWTKEGMSLDVLKKFQVRYDPFSNRLVYPIRNYDGKIVNVSGRTLETDFKERGIRKYTYFKKWGGDMNVVFGAYEHREAIKEKNEIILFEGAKSVFIAETWGYNNTAALLTSHLNEGQFRYLIQLGVNVAFALDEEVDITEDRNIQRLRRYCGVSWIKNRDKFLKEKMSPVDAGEEVWKKLYERKARL